MPADFSIKRNDCLPYLRVALTDVLGTTSSPVDLSTATAFFVMRQLFDEEGDTPDNPIVIRRQAAIIDAANGVIEYRWTPADTATAGDYAGEFEIQKAGIPQTYPSDGYIRITVPPDLG